MFCNNLYVLLEDNELNLKNFLTLKKELNAKFWDGALLKNDISEALLEIANNFFDSLNIDVPIKDISMTGSMANYNWTESSDIDLHVVINFLDISEDIDLTRSFLSAKTTLWNKNHNIKLKGHDVEIYIQDSTEPHFSSGIYSILNNMWIIKPERPKRIVFDKKNIKKKTMDIVRRIKLIEKDFQDKNFQQVFNDANILREKIKTMRKAGLEKGGQYSNENLSYKLIRNSGYLEKLNDLTIKSYDRQHSLKQ